MNNDRVIKTYVWHKDQCFFVSTIERDSSAFGDTSRFNETIVWECDWATGKRGEILYTHGSGRGSIDRHLQICKEFYKNGRVVDADD